MDAKPDSDQKRMTEQAQALLVVLQAAINSISATSFGCPVYTGAGVPIQQNSVRRRASSGPP